MIKYIRGLFFKDGIKPVSEYNSKQYRDDFIEDLTRAYKQSGLRVGVYTCGSLSLEVSLYKYEPYYDCKVFDKNLDVVYHLAREVLWVTGCRYYVADYQLKLAESYLYRDWIKEDRNEKGNRFREPDCVVKDSSARIVASVSLKNFPE